MNSTTKLSCAIAAILGGPSGAWSLAAAADDANSQGLQEITVTAQRRAENLQDVPITIQAFTGETLAQLNVATFDDYVKYLPNVSQSSWGPGQAEIYMRGLSVGSQGVQGNGTTQNFPNVAVYLDEQSAQLPSRNLDVYAADMERLEVLEGPQGTLFGAGAQAGVVRYITNKPKLDVTQGNVSAGYGYTSHGDPNSNVEAVLNVPLVSDTLAVRGVVYNDSRGGYINNVPSTFTRQPTDLGIHYANFAGGVPPDSPVINNASQVRNAINPVTYQGFRLSALWKINEEWDALLSQSYQDMHADGVFFQMPKGSEGQALPDLSVTLFNPSYNKDKFENTALTVNGRIGVLKAVYSGGYLVRNIEQSTDYTNYSRGAYADYYQCVGSTAATPAKCYSPSATWSEKERATHQSHEFRLSTPDDWRLRGLVGAFWEDFKIYDQTNFDYKTLPACTVTVTTGCLSDIAPAPHATVGDPNVRGDNVAFFDDVVRGYRQYAFFLSGDFDLIPKVLTVTAGTRYYNFNDTEKGSKATGFGCFEAGPAPCTAGAANLDADNLQQKYTGFKSRGNLTWKVAPDLMLYYTWSQGYRPGGFNRGPGASSGFVPDKNGVGQYITPAGYAPDTLTNNELGWKTEWFEHHLQVNGAVYREDWKNVQLDFFDPTELGNLTFNTNGANYRVKGVELQVVARVVAGLTVQGSASWNSSSQTNSPYLVANNPASVNFGQPITSIRNPYGVQGSPLAQSPPFQANLRARYEWSFNDYLAFVQLGGAHQAHSLSVVGNAPSIAPVGSINQAYDQPSYTTYDGALGLGKEAWTAQIYGQNLTDTRGKTFISSSMAIETQTVIRPRVVGLRFSHKF
jgi:outer membrane receptor protein involved in Fe transport